MSLKSFACLVAVGAMTSSAVAQLPTIGLVDNGDGTGALTVVVNDTGSLAAELSLALTGATLDSVLINESIFDTSNPGANTITGTQTDGLYDTDIATGEIFASFGSDVLTAGTYDFLTFTYTGSGTASASGLVAQLGTLNDGLADSISIDDGGNMVIFGDSEPDGDVDIIDFGLFADNFGLTGQSTTDPVFGDSEPDGDVDIIDFGLFADNFGIGTSVAVPEPTTAVLAIAFAGCTLLGRQKRS